MAKISKALQYVIDLKANLEEAQTILVRVAGTFFSTSEPGSLHLEMTADDQPAVADEILEYLEDQGLIYETTTGFELTKEGKALWES